MKERRTALALLISAILPLTACDSASAEGIRDGKWEITVARLNVKGAPPDIATHSFCITKKEAESITVKSLLFHRYPAAPKHFDSAVMEKGRITGFTRVDTPEREIKGIPVEVNGHYGDSSVTVTETMRLYGYEIIRTFTGRRLGPC